MKPKLPPEFRAENRLEELTIDYGKTPEGTAEFYRELLKSNVVTLGRPAPNSQVKDGFQILDAETRFSVRLLDYRGERVVAIYSSLKRMTDVIPEEYYHETGYLGLNCRTLLSIMMSSDPRSKFALNPGHMRVKTFSPEEIQALLDGTIFKQIEDDARRTIGTPKPVPIPKGTQMLLGKPKVIPTVLMGRLADYFKTTGDVEQAFLGQIYVPSSGQPPHLMICLQLQKNSRRTFDQISVDLGPTIRAAIAKDEFLDVYDMKSQTAPPSSEFIRFFPK